MANISAKRYVCAACGGEYIVTREGNGSLVCCEKPMMIKETDVSADFSGLESAAQKGARYNCAVCGTQILCIKPGNVPSCCGKPLEKQIAFIDAVSE